VKFFQCVASLYPHVFTSFHRFALIFNKTALIFLQGFIIFTDSSFEFQRVRLPWLHR